MDEFTEGLRSQDVSAGLRNLNPNDAILHALAETQTVGMAASVASLIRGRDVIDDAQNLSAIVADQFDIPPIAFRSVVSTLENAGVVKDVKTTGSRVVSFTENVPYYSNLYATLGDAWRQANPTELEQQVLLLVDNLAKVPIARDEVVGRLGLDQSEFDTILEVTNAAQLVKTIEMGTEEILYSPFLGFENPTLIADAVRDHGSAEVSDAFEKVRAEQGIPVSMAGEVVTDAVARGLLIAPSVEKPDGKIEAFATLPYSIDDQILKGQKPILEKALAVIASLRTGQHFGGYSNLPSDSTLINAIDKLLREGYIAPHSSSRRQYRPLVNLAVIRFGPDPMPNGSWVVPTLIDTEDNRSAMRLARDLIASGESVGARAAGLHEATHLLDSGDRFAAPLKTVDRYKERTRLNARQWQNAVDKLMGHIAS